MGTRKQSKTTPPGKSRNLFWNFHQYTSNHYIFYINIHQTITVFTWQGKELSVSLAGTMKYPKNLQGRTYKGLIP